MPNDVYKNLDGPKHNKEGDNEWNLDKVLEKRKIEAEKKKEVVPIVDPDQMIFWLGNDKENWTMP